MSKLAKSRHKEAVRDLSCTSEIIEKLLTVVLCNYFLQFHGSVGRQFQFGEIASQYGRFVSFPFIHDKDQWSDELEALVKVIVSQSNIVGGNRDMSKRARVETLRNLDLSIE
jgi:hypothetical protein